VSVGSTGNTRRITNVTAGVAQTDAVNVSQLQSLQSSLGNDIDKTQEGVAMAFAMSGTSGLAKHEKFALSGGVGTFEGQQGAALGAAMRLDENWSLNAGVAAGMQEGTVGGRVGFRYAW
jgi:autotransporter adhesin